MVSVLEEFDSIDKSLEAIQEREQEALKALQEFKEQRWMRVQYTVGKRWQNCMGCLSR